MPEPRQHAQSRGWIESILRRIPGFKGYLEKEYRRDSDALQRTWLADRLQRASQISILTAAPWSTPKSSTAGSPRPFQIAARQIDQSHPRRHARLQRLFRFSASQRSAARSSLSTRREKPWTPSTPWPLASKSSTTPPPTPRRRWRPERPARQVEQSIDHRQDILKGLE